MSLPSHNKYKESRVEWLGRVPADWCVQPVKNVAKIVNGYPFDSELFSPDGRYPLIRIRDLGSVVPETFYDGEFLPAAAITSEDLLVGMDGDFNVGRWLGEGNALMNQRVCCVRGNTAILTDFLCYALPFPLKAINDVTYFTTVKHLSAFQIEKTFVAVPTDVEELAEIVTFLDAETGKIDRLIGEQRGLVDLLKEKRQAVVSRAVTKGLDARVTLKDSDVEWLGKVPSHWDVKRIKWVAKMESGHTPDKKVAEYWVDCTIPWITLNDTSYIKENDFIFETVQNINDLGIANSSARLLPPGTVVFSRDATIGRCAITGCEMAVSQHFIAWVCGPDVLPEYLLRCLRSMGHELQKLTFGATLKTIGMPDVRRLAIAIPPPSEQAAIVDYVRASNVRLDRLIREAETTIGLLQERRDALVLAAVSGKIDVRGLGRVQADAA